MTRDEWDTCRSPVLLARGCEGWECDAKLRLAGIASVRALGSEVLLSVYQHLMDVIAAYLDHEVPAAILRSGGFLAEDDYDGLIASYEEGEIVESIMRAASATYHLSYDRAEQCPDIRCLRHVFEEGRLAAENHYDTEFGVSHWLEEACGYIRCTVGRPEWYPVAGPIEPLTWELYRRGRRPLLRGPDAWALSMLTHPDIPRVARRIYEEEEWSLTPYLADALEEDGCLDTEVLAHLRGRGPHARGCWPLDILLQKGAV